jgi:hypothetical protein
MGQSATCNFTNTTGGTVTGTVTGKARLVAHGVQEQS